MSSITIHQHRTLTQTLASSSLALGAFYFLYYKKIKGKCEDKKMPPKAPYTLKEILQELTGPHYPFFLIKVSREINSMVFRYAGFDLLLGCKMAVVVGEAKTALKILTDPLTIKPSVIYGKFNGVTSGQPAMFTSNGEAWHSRRKGLSPAFSSKHIRRMNEVAAQKVDDWINTRLSKLIDNGESFNVAKEMLGITLAAISETAFEYKMTEEEMKEYEHDLEVTCREFFQKSAVNPFREIFGLFYSERRQAHLAADRITNLSLKIMESYRNLEKPMKDTIIDRIMNNEAYKNDKERAAEVTGLLIGGHDTTAYSIAWVLKEIAKNPSVQHELRQSLSTYEKADYHQSPVLRNIAKESIRLHPVSAGGSVRTLGKDFTTSEGYVLPKGSVAFMPNILIHRNPDVFDDADSFIPSRWENATEEMNESYNPFAAGKQNCIGQSLANAEILNIVPRICAEFELELVEEGTVEFFLTLKPINTMIKAKRLVEA